MKFRRVVQVSLHSLLLVLTVTLSFSAVTMPPVKASPDPIVRVTAYSEDPTLNVMTQKVGEYLTCWIHVSDVMNLMGYEFGLEWTTSVLAFQEAVYGYDGVSGVFGPKLAVATLRPSSNGIPWGGPAETVILRPNGVGTYTEYDNVVGAASHWGAVDDVTVDNDTTYIATAVTGDKDVFSLPDPDIPSPHEILSVKVYAGARNVTEQVAKLNLMIRTYDTDYFSPDKLLSTNNTYANHTHTWTTNPNTGSSWTIAEINAMQAGVRSNASIDHRVTQVFAEVTYKAGWYDNVVGADSSWEAVDDVTSDGDTTYIATAAAGDHDLFGLPDGVIPFDAGVDSVKVYAVAKAVAGTPELKLMMRTLGYDFVGTANSLTASYETYSFEWTINPATGLRWTVADINGLQGGVMLNSPYDHRVTQVYVEVKYTFVDSWLVYSPYPGYELIGAAKTGPIGAGGTGYAARVKFLVLQQADSPIGFWKSIITDPVGNEMTHTTYDGSFVQPVSGDLDVDGQVNLLDLVVIAIAWGSASVDNPETPWDETEMWNPEADLTLDEKVDVDDLYECVYNWGRYAGTGT